MLEVLPIDMIQAHFVQHLSKGSRGPAPKVELWEIVHAILYKLKSGVHWHLLPIKSLIISVEISWFTIYHHYLKWCKDGSWQLAWEACLEESKPSLDLSTVQLDGTHSLAKRGGEAVGYQGRKKAKTTNILCLTDKRGTIVSWGKPVSGNHNDLFEKEGQVTHMLDQMKRADISIDGLFLNADAGFDAKGLRKILDKEGITLNVAPNKRNGSNIDSDIIFDPQMYQDRFVIERTNAWMDSFRTLLVRQDTTSSSWEAWHFMASTCWHIKNQINQKEKL